MAAESEFVRCFGFASEAEGRPRRVAKKKLCPPGLEPGTFCVLDRCDEPTTLRTPHYLCSGRLSNINSTSHGTSPPNERPPISYSNCSWPSSNRHHGRMTFNAHPLPNSKPRSMVAHRGGRKQRRVRSLLMAPRRPVEGERAAWCKVQPKQVIVRFRSRAGRVVVSKVERLCHIRSQQGSIRRAS